MKKKMMIAMIVVLNLVIISGCPAINPRTERPYVPRGQQATVGVLSGAAVGAGVGQAIKRNREGTIIGLIIGGVLGGVIGHQIDKDAMAEIKHVYQSTPPGKSSSQSGQRICRPATIRITTNNGRVRIMHSTACRDRQGRWQIRIR